MSLLQRKNAKNAAKTNDFRSLTWDKLALTIDKAETTVGKNAQIRYGIATETDVGLTSDKYVLIPVVTEWKDEAALADMYAANLTMVGIHPVLTEGDKFVKAPFPGNSTFEHLHQVEYEGRSHNEAPVIEGDPEYTLGDAGGNLDSGRLTFICAHLNYMQLSADYPDIPEGVRIAGSHAVAMGFRTGILESVASREFLFVHVTIDYNGGYKIGKIDPMYNVRKNKVIKTGDVHAPDVLKMHPQLIELGLGICIGAGTTHYMMNHTTGGQKLNGHNLKALALNNLYQLDPEIGDPSEVRQTEFIYNVTHPVNKRAVANLVLLNSRVYCWYRNVNLPCPSVIYSDTFMAYRQNLVPSGAHKAYVAAFVLRQIAADSLAIFLPDVELAKKVVRLYGDITRYGARAHVGSRYYTDEPVAISQGEVDDFLPLAAYYVQQKMATSSIASSPHLSPEIADAAHAKWKNIIDATIKTGAFNAPIEQIKAYLLVAGEKGFTVDLNTEQGIKDALAVNDGIGRSIEQLF